MSSEPSYARRGRHQPLHEQVPSGTPDSWSDHELWQRAGESSVIERAPAVSRVERVPPRVERVVEPEAAVAMSTDARGDGVLAETAATMAELPTLDEVVAEIPMQDDPVVAQPTPADAAEPARRAGPRLHRRREIGRSLFRTFDSARHRCGGRPGTRVGGF
ncbi:MAG: hypothetical protein ACREVN_05285 [Gammaproteobacteria bacterium]